MGCFRWEVRRERSARRNNTSDERHDTSHAASIIAKAGVLAGLPSSTLSLILPLYQQQQIGLVAFNRRAVILSEIGLGKWHHTLDGGKLEILWSCFSNQYEVQFNHVFGSGL